MRIEKSHFRQFIDRRAEVARGREESGKARFSLSFWHMHQSRKSKTRSACLAACKRSQYRHAKERKSDGGGDRIPWKTKKALRAALTFGVCPVLGSQLSKNQRLARLDKNTREVKFCACSSQCWLDEIEFTRRYASRDKEQIGFNGLLQCHIEGLSRIRSRRQNPRLAPSGGNQRGQHWGI